MAGSKLLILVLVLMAASLLSPSKAQEGFIPPEGCDAPVKVEPGRLIQCRCLPTSLRQHPIEEKPYPPNSSQRTSGIKSPAYPAEAKAKKVKGRVQLSLGVDGTGRITDVMLIRGAEIFRRAAVDAACSSWLTPSELRDFNGRGAEEERLKYAITFIP